MLYRRDSLASLLASWSSYSLGDSHESFRREANLACRDAAFVPITTKLIDIEFFRKRTTENGQWTLTIVSGPIVLQILRYSTECGSVTIARHHLTLMWRFNF